MYLSGVCGTLGCVRTGETWRLGRRPALDGLRGIAVLLVVISHTGAPWFRSGGTLGVTVFFALSGFLITSLLLEERARGAINLRAFYARRARRLFPALAAMLATVTLLAAVGAAQVPRVDILGAAFYFENWRMAGNAPDGLITHTWSLAVEEQFYLVWPLLLIAGLLVIRQRWLAVVVGLVAAASALSTFFFLSSDAMIRRAYYGSDTRAYALLAGCVLALVLSGRVVRLRPPSSVLPLACVALIVWTATSSTVWVRWGTGPVTTSILATVAIGAVCIGPAGLLKARWLRLVGQRSYALYLWHPVCLGLASAHIHRPVLAVTVALGASWVLTLLSWRLVERPFLRTSQVASGQRVHDGRPVSAGQH